MTIRPETQTYVDAVERLAKRSLRFRPEITELVELAETKSMKPVFAELIFLSKFSSNAVNIFKRAGSGSDETVKLSAELKESLAKISGLLERMTADAPGEVNAKFKKTFLSGNPVSFENMMKLLTELSWVKNYENDRERGTK